MIFCMTRGARAKSKNGLDNNRLGEQTSQSDRHVTDRSTDQINFESNSGARLKKKNCDPRKRPFLLWKLQNI